MKPLMKATTALLTTGLLTLAQPVLADCGEEIDVPRTAAEIDFAYRLSPMVAEAFDVAPDGWLYQDWPTRSGSGGQSYCPDFEKRPVKNLTIEANMRISRRKGGPDVRVKITPNRAYKRGKYDQTVVLKNYVIGTLTPSTTKVNGFGVEITKVFDPAPTPEEFAIIESVINSGRLQAIIAGQLPATQAEANAALAARQAEWENAYKQSMSGKKSTTAQKPQNGGATPAPAPTPAPAQPKKPKLRLPGGLPRLPNF